VFCIGKLDCQRPPVLKNHSRKLAAIVKVPNVVARRSQTPKVTSESE